MPYGHALVKSIAYVPYIAGHLSCESTELNYIYGNEWKEYVNSKCLSSLKLISYLYYRTFLSFMNSKCTLSF